MNSDADNNRSRKDLFDRKKWLKSMPLWFLFVGAFLIPVCVNFGVSNFYTIVSRIFPESLLRSISAGDQGDWIGFWGSFLGGLCTLIALVVTIKNESSRAEEAKRIREAELFNDSIDKDMAHIDGMLVRLQKMSTIIKDILKTEKDDKEYTNSIDRVKYTHDQLESILPHLRSEFVRDCLGSMLNESFYIAMDYHSEEADAESLRPRLLNLLGKVREVKTTLENLPTFKKKV